jgi:hypothetical protein
VLDHRHRRGRGLDLAAGPAQELVQLDGHAPHVIGRVAELVDDLRQVGEQVVEVVALLLRQIGVLHQPAHDRHRLHQVHQPVAVHQHAGQRLVEIVDHRADDRAQRGQPLGLEQAVLQRRRVARELPRRDRPAQQLLSRFHGDDAPPAPR